VSARLRLGVFSVLAVLAVLTGWRIVGQMQAERHALDDPERALRWRPNDPRALQALAERRLRAGDVAGAEALARRLLAHEPLQGEAYRLLAKAAAQGGDRARAYTLYVIASQRAPRDLAARAWLTQYFLGQGDYRRALSQMDSILRMSPGRGKDVFPVLAQLARDTVFGEVLVVTLADSPPWRDAFLASLRHPKTGHPVIAGRVMQGLRSRGSLGEEDYARWVDSLVDQGRWGEAFARWADTLPKPTGRIPMLFNGGFERVPANSGFDWRVQKVPGVLVRFEQVAGASGQVAYLRFLDRRVGEAGLRHPLMLAPGRYRLDLRLRAQALRSELGLQWRIACAGQGGEVARSEAIDGSFGWQQRSLAFSIPASGCPGQWLRLVNPVAAGAGQRVVGELWVDDVVVAVQQ
jgi:tetratricopeptide (TPR) repeat protein